MRQPETKTMGDVVRIIECPRDAWQGLPGHIPAEVKADYLRMLVTAGFTHIDAVSFVSPAVVPQMADSEQVLEYLMPPRDVEMIGIVVNERGAERAIDTGAVQALGFPYSISPQFLERNQRQTPEQSLDELHAIATLAYGAGLEVVAYLSMAFGNPYGDPWSIDEVVAACDLLIDSGVRQISLADTVGLATTDQIADTVAAVSKVCNEIEIGVHLHARSIDAPARIRAAFESGCRRFDAAIGGLGGCPFAQDALVGNIPTETLVAVLAECGATLPALGPLEELIRINSEIARRFGPPIN
jgi:hydroxymethylglutaryl-CoA lyase